MDNTNCGVHTILNLHLLYNLPNPNQSGPALLKERTRLKAIMEIEKIDSQEKTKKDDDEQLLQQDENVTAEEDINQDLSKLETGFDEEICQIMFEDTVQKPNIFEIKEAPTEERSKHVTEEKYQNLIEAEKKSRRSSTLS